MTGSTTTRAMALAFGLGLGAAGPLAAEGAGALPILAGTCVTCHGPEGRSPGAIPAIAGRPVAELEALMLGFRDGSRAGTVMPRLMKGHDRAQIAALAGWFAEAER